MLGGRWTSCSMLSADYGIVTKIINVGKFDKLNIRLRSNMIFCHRYSIRIGSHNLSRSFVPKENSFC